MFVIYYKIGTTIDIKCLVTQEEVDNFKRRGYADFGSKFEILRIEEI